MEVTRGVELPRVQARAVRDWTLAWAMLVLVCLPCAALPVVNGDFEAGLTGWTAEGDVTAVSSAALGDDNVIYSSLYQGVPLASGPYRLEFDVLNLLAGSVLEFPDTFYASLYFINDLGAFDLAATPPVYDDVVPLFDMDASGVLNLAGTLSPSALGGDWMHFVFDFSDAYAYVIPVFELLDFDGIGANSAVLLDNVMVTVIPEPATILMVGLGLAGWGAWRRGGFRRAARQA